MGLSCSCSEWEGEPGTWGFDEPDDFTKLQSKRRKRCSSCKQFIDIGSDCLEFRRVRAPETEEEGFKYDTEVPIRPLYMCSVCGEIYLNLTAAGYCLSIDDEMSECLAEYHEATGFVPEKEEEMTWGGPN